MKKKILIFICSIIVFFSAYFFMFSPQAKKSISIDGTSISTMRMYQAIKYPLFIKKEFKNENNEIIDKSQKDNEENKDEKLYLLTHFEYPGFLVSIDDFKKYVKKLQESGFLVVTAVNPSLLEGKGCFYELVLPLENEDSSILVALDYNYARKVPTISYVKLPGKPTENNEEVKDEEIKDE